LARPIIARRHGTGAARRASAKRVSSAAAQSLEPPSQYDAENLSSAMSLVASTGGVTLLPLYARNLLSPAVVVRPLQGAAPTIDLVMGYSRSSTSSLLKRFLARADELIAAVSAG
jgi:LysR family hca operon transcriptional activator